MHPAKSVIFFTTASGAGYGLIVWLAVLGLCRLVPVEQSFGFVAFGLAFLLITSGLLSSTLHLGRPERAWRALSQWRSSWLSREGVAAILGFIPMGFLALAWVFFDLPSWGLAMAACALIMALVTVFITSMIYGSLKSIPAWHNLLTPPGYLILSLATGGILAALLCALWGYAITGHVAIIAAITLILGLLIKYFYWHRLDNKAAVSTAESATGLGRFGKVRLIEGPHTESNYLLDEMGFRVARKHAIKLRRLSLIGFMISALIAGLSALLLSGTALIIALILAVLAATFAVVVERWLYFAEARHVVTLYYGEATA